MENQKVELCFYSPEGNFEVWESKPEGYYTEAEWLELHPELKPKEPSLDELKEQKIAQINAMRDSKINGGIVFEGKEFQSDEKSRNLLTSTTALYFIAGATPSGFGWIATDNEVVPMDLDKLKSFSGAMGEHVSTNMTRANKLKKAVDSAKSKTALEKIKVEF